MKTTVWCKLQFEATHSWPGCPYDEVDYLRVSHRHVFHIKAYKEVSHADRDTEFIMLKHRIQDYLVNAYYDDNKKLGIFNAKSCEMLAIELIDNFGLCACEVSEDDENGSFVEV